MSSTNPEALNSHILTIRSARVILDADLARLYGVPTFRFNEAVKRNKGKFPRDFRFQLSADEIARLISQIAISKTGRGGRRYRPWAFTEHGSLMAATVLNSPRAVQMSLFVIRAFVRMREDFAGNAAILRRLAEVDKTLLEHDASLQVLWRRMQLLLAPPSEKPKRRIGFPICDR
jgi:hypothetical protein